MKNIMLDLETMGCGPNAAIIAIGACEFDHEKILSHFYVTVDLQSAVDAGGVIDASTVMWWLRQSDEARGEFAKPAIDIVPALNDFRLWITDVCHVEGEHPDNLQVWGNGSNFDNLILASAYKNSRIPQPWSYRGDRCYRSIRSSFPHIKADAQSGTHHNALDDAIYQARHLIKILQHISAPLPVDCQEGSE